MNCPICNKPYSRMAEHSDGEMSFTHKSEPKTSDHTYRGRNIEYDVLSFCHTSQKERS